MSTNYVVSIYNYASRVRSWSIYAELLLFVSWIRPFSLFRFRIKFWNYDRTAWVGDQPNSKPVPTKDSRTQKKGEYTSILGAGLELTIPDFGVHICNGVIILSFLLLLHMRHLFCLPFLLFLKQFVPFLVAFANSNNILI